MARVLVADDEKALVDTYADIVRNLGLTCATAFDGVEALAVARRERPDVVVLDHMMPLKTGVEVIRAMRADATLAAIPTVLVSAVRPRGHETAWRFVPKPVRLDEFERAIREAVELAKERLPDAVAGPESRLELAREDMLNWISHEIRSPLSAALLNSEMALREAATEKLKRRLQIVSRSLRRMDDLVTSVLDAAKMQDGKLVLKLEQVDASEFLKVIVADWRDALPGYEFELTLAADGVKVLLDRLRIRQVVDNLVSNAVKYAPDSKKVLLALARADGHITVSVTDFGPGIPPDQQRLIFERFHRIDGTTGRGHGLGLYIAAALAKLHGGELSVDSAPGDGTTFTLRLPVALAAVDELVGE